MFRRNVGISIYYVVLKLIWVNQNKYVPWLRSNIRYSENKLCIYYPKLIRFPGIVFCGLSNYSFPDDFQFGVATASYQVEGGWNEGGKWINWGGRGAIFLHFFWNCCFHLCISLPSIGRTESIWDYELHKNPNITDDRSNGDIACDSYHKWKEDIQLVQNLGVDFYRFSISWSRLLPSASKGSELSKDGVMYYNKIIDELIARKIVPYITIFHWDTPQSLEFNGK